MPRLAVVLMMLLLAGLACSLSSDEEAATAVPIIRTSTPTLIVTRTLNVTPTAGITLQPTAEQFRTAVPPATIVNCTPRTDWVLYTVKAGDTLGVIAQNVGSTITDLTRANCLANPDSIVVGQQLRVPRLPASTTSGSTTSGSTTSGSTTSGTGSTTSGSTTSGTGSTTSGSTTGSTTSGDTSKAPKLTQNLSAAPVITLSASEVVTLQPSISLNVGVVENADTVKYFASDAANLSGAVNVGTDVDPFDGTAITYTFNEFDSVLYFYAEAANEFGTTRGTALKITYNPNYDPNPNDDNDIVRATPYIGFDGSLYTLQEGATVTLSWTSAPTSATRVEFYLTPNGGGTPSLLGTDSNPADGASISWTVPQDVLGTLSATAIQGSGIVKSSLTSSVYSE